MSTGVKIFLWILLILAVLAVIGFFWVKSIWDSISFSPPSLQGLNLQGLTLTDLASIAFEGQSKTVTVTLAMAIKNDNNFSIPFSNMKVKLYYDNTIIAETSNLISGKQVVPANGALTVSDTVNVILNNAGGKLLIDKINGGHPSIDYSISLKVFGIPLPNIKNNFTW